MKPSMLIAMLFVIATQAGAQTIFVKPNAVGTGASWSDATGNLAQALRSAKAGSSVWVAAGTYVPGNSRSQSFLLKPGVEVLGGFNGTEGSADERNPEMNETILSGEIGNPGMADNTYNVVTIENAGASTLLDGFTISGGNANGEGKEGEKVRCGGGLFILASIASIQNCTFKGNAAKDGAAVYNNGRGKESSPTFKNCTFLSNEAGLDGGALYNDARQNGKVNSTLTNCTFEKNSGTYGGAICNATDNGTCNLTLEQCAFNGNEAMLRGGAIFSLNGNEKCYLESSSCSFERNYPDDQNMIFTSTEARSIAYKVTGD